MTAFVPPAVVTKTLAVPAVPTGVVHVMLVALATVMLDALAPPKVTSVAPVKLTPVIVTIWPPTVGPLLGAIDVTLGGVT